MSVDLVKAAQAKTLVEQFGYSENQAGKELNISHNTVGQIVNGEGRWADLGEKDPLFNKIRQVQKEKWWKSIWSLQPKLLQNIENKLAESSAASSTWMFGVLFDKERLLAGESTANIAVAHHVEVEDLNDAADRIAHSLLRFSQATDVTPGPELATESPMADRSESAPPSGITLESDLARIEDASEGKASDNGDVV